MESTALQKEAPGNPEALAASGTGAAAMVARTLSCAGRVAATHTSPQAGSAVRAASVISGGERVPGEESHDPRARDEGRVGDLLPADNEREGRSEERRVGKECRSRGAR